MKTIFSKIDGLDFLAKELEYQEISLVDFCNKYRLDELAKGNGDADVPSEDLAEALSAFNLFYSYSLEKDSLIISNVTTGNRNIVENALKEYMAGVIGLNNSGDNAKKYFDYATALKDLMEFGKVKVTAVTSGGTTALLMMNDVPTRASVPELKALSKEYPDVSLWPKEDQYNVVMLSSYYSDLIKAVERLAIVYPEKFSGLLVESQLIAKLNTEVRNRGTVINELI